MFAYDGMIDVMERYYRYDDHAGATVSLGRASWYTAEATRSLCCGMQAGAT